MATLAPITSGDLPALDPTPPRLEVHRQVVATQSVVAPPPQLTLRGCLYGEDGRLLPLSQRTSGHDGDYFHNADPATLPALDRAALPVLEGRSLYLGHYFPHYGHFLVEMLSTFWVFESFAQYDHFVFHPFINSAVVAGYRDRFPPHVLAAFAAFGIDAAKVRLVDRPLLLREATIPERLVQFNRGVNARVREVYRQLRQRFGASDRGGGRYYLSRVGNSLRAASRVVVNEPALQRALRRLGFTVLYPETMAFAEQVRVLGSAEVLCGLSGSALHNCVFQPPGSLLVEIGGGPRLDQTSNPMQQLCNQLAPVRGHCVPFRGRMLHRENMMSLIDVRATVDDIAAALRAHGQPASPLVAAATPVAGKLAPAAERLLALRMAAVSWLRLGKWWLQARGRGR